MGPQTRGRSGRCWQESGAPPGSNENQQARKRSPVCAPDTKQAWIWRAGAKPCCSPATLETLRVTRDSYPQGLEQPQRGARRLPVFLYLKNKYKEVVTAWGSRRAPTSQPALGLPLPSPGAYSSHPGPSGFQNLLFKSLSQWETGWWVIILTSGSASLWGWQQV